MGFLPVWCAYNINKYLSNMQSNELKQLEDEHVVLFFCKDVCYLLISLSMINPLPVNLRGKLPLISLHNE